MVPRSPECPYGAENCPKLLELEARIDELESDIRTQSGDLKTISRYVYLLVGMVAINWGISLW